MKLPGEAVTTDHDIFKWLDQIRPRRSMYVQNIVELQTLIHGYYIGLGAHGIREPGPQMTQGHFGVWLREVTGWSLCSGWAYATEQNTDAGVDVFDRFFSFVDQYRQLQPTVTARVVLSPHHQASGKRVVIGMDGRMDRPDEILAIHYAPTSLNHLRHRYGDRFVDHSFLMLGNGSHQTTQSDLFDWVADEFGVNRSEWELNPGIV